ncbi:MAG TPA: TIGR00730 family Rossman fold protein [Xanthobacteraceae bacterium]|nr:TIGR00730 family Rossman fold protein [Xanthobacteraceae bacterium]
MNKINALCVYCGSSVGADPAFADAARSFGKILAASGVRLVYGGGSIGLMGVLAKSVIDHGGEVTGVIPEFLTAQERPRRLAQEQIVTRDMHERKRTMFERADAFVALPGGLGTLEELVEQMTWAQLGRHKKPILVANINGFWDPLLALVDHMRALGLVPPPARGVNLLVAERIEDVLPKLREAARTGAEAEKRMAVPVDRL